MSVIRQRRWYAQQCCLELSVLVLLKRIFRIIFPITKYPSFRYILPSWNFKYDASFASTTIQDRKRARKTQILGPRLMRYAFSLCLTFMPSYNMEKVLLDHSKTLYVVEIKKLKIMHLMAPSLWHIIKLKGERIIVSFLLKYVRIYIDLNVFFIFYVKLLKHSHRTIILIFRYLS